MIQYTITTIGCATDVTWQAEIIKLCMYVVGHFKYVIGDAMIQEKKIQMRSIP